MILTATSESTRLVEYEWTINGVIYGEKTKSINVDVSDPDVVSVRALNDCGNWSQPLTLDWEKVKKPMDEMILYVALFIAAFLMFRSG